MTRTKSIGPCIFLAASAIAQAQASADEMSFVTDPTSPVLRELAKPLEVDEAKYDCGPLRQAGLTYYVALHGDDANDGRSWERAWRHVRHGVGKLQAGDTLVVCEGEYFEPHLDITCHGEPGRPIVIMAAPRHRVIVSGARPVGPLRRVPDTRFIFEAAIKMGERIAVWESDTLIALENAGSTARVEELPGTYCYDDQKGRLCVHFSDSRGPDVHRAVVGAGGRDNPKPFGVEVRGSYLHLKGLQFKHYHTAVALRAESMEPKRGGEHITVEKCVFFGTEYTGLALHEGARWNLAKDNYGIRNGLRGSILTCHQSATDNLAMGNWLDPSPQTLRTPRTRYHYAIGTYAGVCRRNHIVNNTMNDILSFRSKKLFKESVIQGNVMTGSFGTVAWPYGGKGAIRTEADHVVIRGNVMLGPVGTAGHPMAPGGPGTNWSSPVMTFIDNFAPRVENPAGAIEQAKFADRGRAIEDARFADPAYVDYRLQSDSPFIGKALGGGDVGAFREPRGRVLYVGPDGNDEAAGTSQRLALRTLHRATSQLRPGDTLYVMVGDYRGPLTVRASGTRLESIQVRAYGKRVVVLPGIVVAGSHVTVEGFTLASADGHGVVVTGDDVTLKHCVMRDCAASGVQATGAKVLTLRHCTLVGNAEGLTLERGSEDAVVRDCIFASNRGGTIEFADDSRRGYLGSSNCYFGEGLDRERIEGEMRSVVADPKFVDVANGDLRLQWDSPAAHLARFGHASGAMAALARTPEIEDISVSGVTAESARVTWRTPKDDTTATVCWREAGSDQWRQIIRTKAGSVHGVGLTGRKSQTEYELKIEAKSRRGGAATSAIRTFRTSDQPHAPTTYYVDPTGDDQADGRSPRTAWETIRRANFAVAAGDTVLIAPGVYRHAVAPLCAGAPTGRITFRKHGEGEAIIDGAGVVAPLVLLHAKHYVTVDGLTFANLPREGHPGVVRGDVSRSLEVLNCRVGYYKRHSGFGRGIMLYRCADARIEGNLIWGTRYHCDLSQCPNTLVKNNTFAYGQVFSTYFHGDHRGCRFVNNVFFRPTSVPNAALAISFATKDIRLTSDYNCFGPMVARTHVAYVYKGYVTNVLVPGSTLEHWQKNSGQDRHSIQADPMFVNPGAGDFRLKPNSPAIGAGEDGVNMGACGVAMLGIRGRSSLRPGEGRTIRMTASPSGPASGKDTFRWELPRGEKRQDAVLEYTPPDDVNRFELKLAATDARGRVTRAQVNVSVPPPELAQPRDDMIKIEGEDFVAQGGGEVRFYQPVNASGKSFSHWNRSIGHWLEWELAVVNDGQYLIYARYTTNLRGRSRSLTIDGATPSPAYEKIAFPCTGGWSLTEDNWAFKKLGPAVTLTAGKHRFRMTNLDSAVNVDYFVVVPVTTNR